MTLKIDENSDNNKLGITYSVLYREIPIISDLSILLDIVT